MTITSFSGAIVFVFSTVLVGTCQTHPSSSSASANNGPLQSEASILEQHNVHLDTVSLINALQNTESAVRSSAALQLATIDEVGAIPDIAAALTAEKIPITRINLASALAALGDTRGLSVLLETCSDAHTADYLKLDAARHLEQYNHGCVSQMEHLSSSSHEASTRAEALSMLEHGTNFQQSDLANIRTVEIHSLADTDAAVRILAARGLGQSGIKSARSYLEQRLNSETDESVRVELEHDITLLE